MIDRGALSELQAASFTRAGPGLRASWPPRAAMDGAQLETFLLSQRYCVLATTTPRGRPIARPVAFLVLGASVWLATVEGSRLRNLRLTPWVSLVVSAGEPGSHEAVIIDGPATLVESAPESVQGAWSEQHGSRADWADAWAEVRPDRLLSYAAHHDA